MSLRETLETTNPSLWDYLKDEVKIVITAQKLSGHIKKDEISTVFVLRKYDENYSIF